MNNLHDSFFEKLVSSTEQMVHNSSSQPRILLGLSGGPDSVFLYKILLKLATQHTIELHIAHFDHQWRATSHQDAQFCADLATKDGISYTIGKASDYQDKVKKTGSKEDLGRRMRQLFFKTIQEKLDYSHIALAHHADDQLETFFVRLARGSTLEGLCGIKQTEKNIIRPLLHIKKDAILSYLHDNNIEYINDYTNFDQSNLRSRIRTTLIPALTKTDSRFIKTLARTINHLQSARLLLNQHVNAIYREIFENHQGNLAQFEALDLYLKHQLLLVWLEKNNKMHTPSSSFLSEITKFLTSGKKSSHQLTQGLTIKKTNRKFWID